MKSLKLHLNGSKLFIFVLLALLSLPIGLNAQPLEISEPCQMFIDSLKEYDAEKTKRTKQLDQRDLLELERLKKQAIQKRETKYHAHIEKIMINVKRGGPIHVPYPSEEIKKSSICRELVRLRESRERQLDLISRPLLLKHEANAQLALKKAELQKDDEMIVLLQNHLNLLKEKDFSARNIFYMGFWRSSHGSIVLLRPNWKIHGETNNSYTSRRGSTTSPNTIHREINYDSYSIYSNIDRTNPIINGTQYTLSEDFMSMQESRSRSEHSTGRTLYRCR